MSTTKTLRISDTQPAMQPSPAIIFDSDDSNQNKVHLDWAAADWVWALRDKTPKYEPPLAEEIHLEEQNSSSAAHWALHSGVSRYELRDGHEVVSVVITKQDPNQRVQQHTSELPHRPTLKHKQDKKTPKFELSLAEEIYLEKQNSSSTSHWALHSGVSRSERPHIPTLKYKQDRFTRTLLNLLEQEPVEVGCRHPAEKVLAKTLATYGSTATSWIQAIYLRKLKRQPAISAGILRCIGRMNKELTTPWGLVMAISGLSLPDIGVREAAVRALEMWGDTDSLETLKVYVAIEKELWLKEYIEDVIADLESE